MSLPNTVTVNILGREYQVACPAEQEPELTAAASYLDRQMLNIRDQGKVVGLERIAVMAALNVCHELLRAPAQSSSTTTNEDSCAAVEQLTRKLETALNSLGKPGS
ncbi:MAG: cell division protein ZapA [Halieaceae bacterium]|nr:cell division protein ZapA [Halieaceae bacterium]